MKKAKIIPSFRSEAEEIEFWDSHNPDEYMTEPVDIIWDIRPERKKRVTVRVEPKVVTGLKGFAGEHDTRYQTLARGLTTRGKRRFQEAR